MGVSGLRHALAVLYPLGKNPQYPLDRRLGGPQRLEEKSSASVGDLTLVIQSVVSHHTDWATPAPSHTLWPLFNWGSFSVIRGSMSLQLFLTLCPLSLNGSQHKTAVIRDAIIIVNTLNQQNLQPKVNISLIQKQRRTFKTCEYLKCPKNTGL
jgi:hypothetical protein